MTETPTATAPEPSAAPAKHTVRDLDRRTLTEPAAAQLLDVRQVAALLNCSERHVWRLHDGGKMPSAVRLGALVRWPRRVIEEWIGAGCPPCRPRGGRDQ
jgi:excisionase family DNA binding protein